MPVFARFRKDQLQVFLDQRECFAGTCRRFIDGEGQFLIMNYELRNVIAIGTKQTDYELFADQSSNIR